MVFANMTSKSIFSLTSLITECTVIFKLRGKVNGLHMSLHCCDVLAILATNAAIVSSCR